MRYLITGGCGFIGTNLVSGLLKHDKNAYIRIIDNLKSGRKSMLANVCDYTEPSNFKCKNGEVHLFVADINNAITAMRMCKGIDTIIHLAANTGVFESVQYPLEDCYDNVVGTLNYLEAARHNKARRFIFASSGSLSGGYVPPFHEKLFPRPIAPYGASKASCEAYCHVYNATYGISTVALRFSNIYGPNSVNKEELLIPNFILGALNDRKVYIFGDGTQTRDYCYVDDLMDAIMISIKKASMIGGQVIQIATNQETSVQRIADVIISELVKYDMSLHIEYVKERPGDLQRDYSDVSKAKKLLGWSYKTDLKEGISKTIKWFIRNKL
jgi:UDP-glucose 4-epimerase